jgi:tetratricopeptide (TPR) repeat protein
VNFAAIGEYEEARRMAPEFQWKVNAIQQRWSKAIEQARQGLDESPRDYSAKMNLANVLHLSGELPAAQEIYEHLFETTNRQLIIDAATSSFMATVRMAYGRLSAGDTKGAEEIIEIVRREIRAREQAGIHDSLMLRAAFTVAAIEGNREQVISNLEAAIDTGLRDHYILREPALEPYREDPEFQALSARLDEILEEERSKTLQLICLNNPAAEVWQPLPETCAGVEESG